MSGAAVVMVAVSRVRGARGGSLEQTRCSMTSTSRITISTHTLVDSVDSATKVSNVSARSINCFT